MRTGGGSRAGLRRAGGLAIGVVLLGAAVFAVWHARGTVTQALDSFTHAPWWAVALLLVIPLVGWLTASGALWALTRRHGVVGLGEMTALVGSAWLLNFLPMKPGLVGRVVYHKRVNNIPVRASVRVLVEAVALTAISAAVILGVALGGRAIGVSAWAMTVALLAPAIALVPFALAPGRARWVTLGALFKYADMLVWVARYALVFWVLDIEVGLAESVVIAGVSQLAILVPVAANGLGVREWAVGAVGGLAGAGLEPALVADLLNRAAELIVVVPVGLICIRLVARSAARSAARARQSPDAADAHPESSDPGPDPADKNQDDTPPVHP